MHLVGLLIYTLLWVLCFSEPGVHKMACYYGDGYNESNKWNFAWFLTESAARPDSREPSHEVLAPQTEQTVEVVIGWNVYFQAVWVLQVSRSVAALFWFISVQRVCNHMQPHFTWYFVLIFCKMTNKITITINL